MDPLQSIMSLLQAPQPKRPVSVRPDYGLTGAQVLQTQKSPYERTLRPGETRSAEDLQGMLAEVIMAAGSGALPGAGPRGQARQIPAGRRKGQTFYHGTDAEFETFSPTAARKNPGYTIPGGMYFTSSPKEAAAYGKRVVPAQLDIKNPLLIKTDKEGWASTELDASRYHIMRQILESRKTGKPYDSVVAESPDGNRTVVVFDPLQIGKVK